jgi:hypothetical protein
MVEPRRGLLLVPPEAAALEMQQVLEELVPQRLITVEVAAVVAVAARQVARLHRVRQAVRAAITRPLRAAELAVLAMPQMERQARLVVAAVAAPMTMATALAAVMAVPVRLVLNLMARMALDRAAAAADTGVPPT